MINRFETFITSIVKIYRCVQNIKSREMTELGLRGTHVMCLFNLRRHEEGLTASELSVICEEDKAAVSRALSQLEENGLVHVEDNDAGRRYRSNVRLTETGRRVSDRMTELIESAVTKGGAGITDEDRETFYKVLRIISHNLQDIYETEGDMR